MLSCLLIHEYMTGNILDICIHDLHCQVAFKKYIHFISKEVETSKWHSEFKLVLYGKKHLDIPLF